MRPVKLRTDYLSAAMRGPVLTALSVFSLLTVSDFARAAGFGDENSPISAESNLLAAQEQPEQTLELSDEKQWPRKLEVRVVRRTDNQPIPGATVVVYATDQHFGGAKVASHFRSEARTDDRGLCVFDMSQRSSLWLTNDHGRRLVKMPFGCEMWTTRDGFAPGYQHITFETDRPGLQVRDGTATVVEELEPGEPIGGQVRDEQKRTVGNAQVIVAFDMLADDADIDVLSDSQPGLNGLPVLFQSQRLLGGNEFPVIRVKTDAQGRWRCSCLPAHPDPRLRLFIQVKHLDYASDTGAYFRRRLSLKTARAMTGVLIMKSGVRVSGEVRDGKGAAVPGARVALAYTNLKGNFLATRTDAAGRFVFPHVNNEPILDLDRCIVSAEALGPAPERKVIVLRDKVAEAVFRLAPGKPFHGRIVDKVGRPVAGVTVTAGERQGYRLSWRTETDANGRFAWLNAPPKGQIDFDLRKLGYAETRVLLDTGAIGQVVLTIDPDGTPRAFDPAEVVPDGMFGAPEYQLANLIFALEPFAPMGIRWLIWVLWCM